MSPFVEVEDEEVPGGVVVIDTEMLEAARMAKTLWEMCYNLVHPEHDSHVGTPCVYCEGY